MIHLCLGLQIDCPTSTSIILTDSSQPTVEIENEVTCSTGFLACTTVMPMVEQQTVSCQCSDGVNSVTCSIEIMFKGKFYLRIELSFLQIFR